jgi:anhydro-N-acetylmuramic acid kinase
MQRFVGLISGTSGDGIDAAIISTDGTLEIRTESYRCIPFSEGLAQRLQHGLSHARELGAAEIESLDEELADAFANAALDIIETAGLSASDITAVGSHGQTLIHDMDAQPPQSLQVGDPQRIADLTGLTTVGDFRTADIQAGGQGAPLAPAFHAAVLGDSQARGVLNLGGISNLTVIQPGQDVIGFDIGPANTLLDAWFRLHMVGDFDTDGDWASSGTIDQALLTRLLDDPFFMAEPPKSTGRDHFTLDWLRTRCVDPIAPEDVQATLVALTTRTIADHVERYAPAIEEILICGGGVHNRALMDGLRSRIRVPVISSAERGLDPDSVEACTFAWIASRTLADLPGNLPSVTGAREARVLGRLFHPRR